MSGILAIWNDREQAIAKIYERWYVSEHVPERLGVPGFLCARRYEAAQGSPRFFTYYEVASPDVLASPEYLSRLASPSPLTRKVMGGFRNMRRTACSLAYRSPRAALGGCVVAAWVEPPAALDDSRLMQAIAALARDAQVLGVQAWRAVPDPAHAANPEAKLRPDGDSRIEAALVVDCMREQVGYKLQGQVDEALRASISRDAVQGETLLHVGNYRLLGVWSAHEKDL